MALGLHCEVALPSDVRARIDANLAQNAERFERTRQMYEEIARALNASDVELVVLKGFSNWPSFSLDPRHRPQYDLDLLCLPDQVMRAKDALLSLGYEPVEGFGGVPLDHLPAMIRKTGWQWRGDYFDVNMPLGVELHFQLWDRETEHIVVAGLESFWGRRKRSCIGDFCFPALDPADRLAYAALHLFRHLLRGDVRLYHVYELAHFLDSTADDSAFWQSWQNTHGESLRSLEAISFRLASHWFGCRIAPEVRKEFDGMAEPIQRWFRIFGMAPLESKTHPNKNELWLHLSLVESSAGKRAVTLRRLFPVRRPKSMHAACVPESQMTWRLQMARRVFEARFSLARIVHHLRSTLPTVFGGLQWWWAGKGIEPQFLRFLGAVSFFNFGMSIFFLLYNLLLLQRGFQEDFIGGVSSAASIGSLTGTVPAAFVLHRFGLRNTLVGTFSGFALVCVIRAIAAVPFVLIASAFVGGFVFSFYAVSIAPTVAELTTQRARPFGFSLVFSLGIAIAVFAGVAGGRLPALLARGSAPGILPLQNAILVACAIAAMGALPALGLHFRTKPESERRVYPRSPFIKQFLVALLLWSLATGAFNPFFTVYFSKTLAMATGQIGTLFSVAQLVQVLALMLAPFVLRRLGVINGLMTMQIATAVALAALAAGPAVLVAGALFTTYMAFQYMSEPGIYSLLMERVKPEERSGASALNFLVISVGQAVAAALAGFGVRRFGYPVVLICAAGTALLAAVAVLKIPSKPARTS